MTVKQFYLLLLILFPLISHEFLPWSLIAGLSFFLLLKIFWQIPTFLVYMMASLLVYHLIQLFGPVIIPETTVSFLAIMCAMKIVMPKNPSYTTSRFLGFLWAATFVLFRTDLLSLIILILFSALNIKLFDKDDHEKLNVKELWSHKQVGLKGLLFAFICVFILFLVFPRQSNFLPSSRSQPRGMIGYSKEINNSQIESLEMTSQTAFIAQMPEISQDKLYWRGRVHTITDGHNWKARQLFTRPEKQPLVKEDVTYQIKYEQDFEGDVILLDTPLAITTSNLNYYQEAEFSTFKTYQQKKKFFLTAKSSFALRSEFINSRALKKYLQLPPYLTPALNPLLTYLKPAKNLSDILQLFERYLNEQGFVYSLEPKGATTLKGFLENKSGFCTHYASLLGITLRHFKYPARLISGFQGGLYNSSGEHYKITSNDAHAWVEVYDGNKWLRVDPTAYVAMARITRGGESFFSGTPLPSEIKKRNVISRLYFQSMAILETINYKVSLWLDTFDREEQNNWAKSLKLPWYGFLILGLLLFSLLLWLYTRFIHVHTQQPLKLVDKLFLKFKKILKQKGVSITAQDSLAIIKYKIQQQKLPKEDLYLMFLESYTLNKYSRNKDEIKLKKNFLALKENLLQRYWPIR